MSGDDHNVTQKSIVAWVRRLRSRLWFCFIVLSAIQLVQANAIRPGVVPHDYEPITPSPSP